MKATLKLELAETLAKFKNKKKLLRLLKNCKKNLSFLFLLIIFWLSEKLAKLNLILFKM